MQTTRIQNMVAGILSAFHFKNVVLIFISLREQKYKKFMHVNGWRVKVLQIPITLQIELR